MRRNKSGMAMGVALLLLAGCTQPAADAGTAAGATPSRCATAARAASSRARSSGWLRAWLLPASAIGS